MRPEDLRMMFEQKLNGNMFGAVIREYTFQVWVGDALVNNEVFSMDEFSAGMHFQNVVNQIARDSRPMKCKMSYIYFRANGNDDNYIQYTNKPWDNAHK